MNPDVPFDATSFLEAANSDEWVRPENQRTPVYKPRASGLIGCSREQMYSMTNTPRTDLPRPDSIVAQELGRMAEEYSRAIVPKIKSPLVEAGWSSLSFRSGWRTDDAKKAGQDELPESYFVTGHPDADLHQRRFNADHRNEYKETLADGLRWGGEHKYYGAYLYEKAVSKSDIFQAIPGMLAQGLLYGDALGWDAFTGIVIAQDAALMRGKLTLARRYAETGKAKETREKNAALVKKLEETNPKVHIYNVDIRTYKAGYIPELKARADALSELRRQEVNPDDVARERNPETHPLCGYCDWAERCKSVGQSRLVVPESPIKD